MEELERLVDAVDGVLAAAATGKSALDVARGLRVIAREVNRLQAAICDYTAAMKATQAHETTGCASPAEFLKKECHFSGVQAAAVARCSTLLREALPRTAAALRAGEVTWPHVMTVVRGVDALGIKEVCEREEVWIDKIATARGPERLQRVVRARVHETTPKPPVQQLRPSAGSKRIALRLVEGAGYEVNGFVTLNDGATINKAVSALAHEPVLGRAHDPIVTIIRQWLHNEEDRNQSGEAADAPRAEPQPMNKLDRGIDDPSWVHWRHGTAPRHGVVRRATLARSDERCVRPGCRCQPKWCDLHSIIEWIDIGRARAA